MCYHKFQRHRKRWFLAAFACFLLFAANLLYDSIPDEIYAVYGEDEHVEFPVPVTVEKKESSVPVFRDHTQAKQTSYIGQDYLLTCKFLNLIPVKEVSVHVVAKDYVMPSGKPIGIYTKTSGILIIGTGKVTASDGLNYEPADQIVQGGDYILTVNGTEVSEKEELVDLVNASGGNPVVLGILRDNETIEVKIEPIPLKDGTYKLGIWVRDDMAGGGGGGL